MVQKAKKACKIVLAPLTEGRCAVPKPLNWLSLSVRADHPTWGGRKIALRPTPRSADRAWSLARVSQKWEYFKCGLETIGNFALRLFKLGV